MEGYKISSEIRFYIESKSSSYVSAELSFRHLIIKDDIEIGMFPSANIDAWGREETQYVYFKYTEMVFNRYSIWFALKYGNVSVNEKGVYIDYSYGVSIRYVGVSSKSIISEEGVVTEEWQDDRWILHDNFTKLFFVPNIGFKIDFAFN